MGNEEQSLLQNKKYIKYRSKATFVSPLVTERRSTDVFALVLFAVVVVLSFASGICIVLSSEGHDNNRWSVLRLWKIIFGCLATSILSAILFQVGARRAGGIVLPCCMVGIQILLVYASYFIINMDVPLDTNGSGIQNASRDLWYRNIGSIGMIVIAILFFLLNAYMIRKVWLAWSFLKYSNRTINHFRTGSSFLLYVVPIVQTLCSFGVFCLFYIAAYHLANKSTINIVLNLVLQLSCTYWVLQTVTEIGNFIVAFSISLWYFNSEMFLSPVHCNNSTIENDPIRFAIYRTFRYHIGSCITNAAIAGPLGILRSIVPQTKFSSNDDQSAVQCFSSGICCTCQKFSDLFTFINNEAGIITTIHGTGYVTSAKVSKALKVIMLTS